MHASAILGTAIALCGAAVADVPRAPVPTPIAALNKRADATAPWVSVDDEGRPSTTYTPTITTISGSTSVIHGAPHDITASVFTRTNYGVITTRTGAPPNPTAVSKNNDGAFERCFNMDGEYAPFCRPSQNSTLITGNTYYVTWDPDFYNKSAAVSSNMTYEITVRLDYYNTTSKEWTKLETFDDDRVPTSWGFFPFKVTNHHHKERKLTNLTITLLSSAKGLHDKTNSVALPVAVMSPAGATSKPTPMPKGRTLTIALPVTFGALAILLFGVCLWNRKTRRIELGNIMSRSRHGYSGRRVRDRIFRSKRDNNGAIQLDTSRDFDASMPPSHHYHDDAPQRPRRDSDGLDSLANSPINANFEQQGTMGGSRNAFRDEMSRQDHERRDVNRY